jgi:Ca2+-binding RTX toxin-like protein
MRGIFRSDIRRGGSHRVPLLGAGILCFALALTAGPAIAKKITGSKRGERIVGTKKADRIKGKGGGDLIKGKRGNDTLRGGKGGDLVRGGKGIDRHLGGPGNDVLKAADGRGDSVIDGGSGTNRCIVDVAELSIVRNCGTVQGSTPGGGQQPAPGPGPGQGQGLRVLTVDVMCGSPNPLTGEVGCNFHITGDGADEQGPGSVEGSGGVTNVVGGAGSLSPPAWDAFGGYSCNAAGFLRVTIGSESVDVPVPCTPSGPPGS